jgi:type IV pilus assembly protein PilM
VELAREQLHLVQLEKGADGEIEVRARASEPYHAPREEVLASPQRLRVVLRRALKADRFVGRRAVSALPSGEVRILSLSYRPGNREEGAAILDALKDRVEGEVSDYVVDYLPVRGRKGDEERLAVVAISPRGFVIGFLESMRKAGLDVEALEIGPAAIKRLVVTMSASTDPESVLVVNFGLSNSYLTMISGRRLLFDQEVAFGEHSLIQQLAGALDISPELARDLVLRHGLAPGGADAEVSQTLREILKPGFQTLTAEINRALIFAASETHGEPVGRVYLLGAMARWQGVDDLLNALLDIPVATIPDPLHPFRRHGGKGSAPAAAASPEIAVATGLALRGMVSHD